MPGHSPTLPRRPAMPCARGPSRASRSGPLRLGAHGPPLPPCRTLDGDGRRPDRIIDRSRTVAVVTSIIAATGATAGAPGAVPRLGASRPTGSTLGRGILGRPAGTGASVRGSGIATARRSAGRGARCRGPRPRATLPGVEGQLQPLGPLMSDRLNYIGVGLAYRSSNRKTWSAVVLTESTDHTRARRPDGSVAPPTARRAVVLERVGRTTADPHRRAARLRRPVPRRTRDLAACPATTPRVDLDQPGRAAPTATARAIRARATASTFGNAGACDLQRAAWSAVALTRRQPMARHPFAAVNLISDPIHGYLELTKRLTPAEARGRRPARRGRRRGGPPRHRLAPATAADQPAPERSLGLPDRRALAVHARPGRDARGRPVGSGALPLPAGRARRRRRPSGPAPVRGPRGRDPAGRRACSTTWATGRSPTSSTTTCCRRSRRPPDARRAARQAADPRGPLAADHRARAGRADPRPAPRARAPSRSATRSVTARRSTRAGSRSSSRSPRSATRRCRAGSAGSQPLLSGRVHRRQPRLRPARRLPHRGDPSGRSTSSGCAATRSSPSAA